MICNPENIERIIQRLKTATRRLAQEGDYLEGGTVYNANGNARWTVGGCKPIQPGRGRPTVRVADLRTVGGVIHQWVKEGDGMFLDAMSLPLRVRILSICRQDVRHIIPAEARAEGYADEIDFWADWIAMHDKALWLPREKPGRFVESVRRTLPEFQAVLLQRPLKYYDAWALTFEVVR